MAAWSLRLRITTASAIAVTVVLVIVSVVLVLSQRRQLTANLDASLRQRADDIAALVAETVPAELGAGSEEAFSQLVSGDGVVVAATRNILDRAPLAGAIAGDAAERIQTVGDLVVDDDDEFRLLTRAVTVAGEPATLHVGADFESVGDSTEALTSTLAVLVPAVASLLAWLVWVLVGRTLRPVVAIRRQVDEIGGDDLDRRVPVPLSNDEIASLAVTMNGMLDRLEDSAAAARRFVADASHELRSPLTRMRSEIEVDLRSPDVVDQTRLASIHEEVVELQQLVEDLLHLARTDAKEHATAFAPVDLDDVVFDAARTLQGAGKVEVDTSAVSGAQVSGDVAQLRRVVQNLAENAERYANRRVEFRLQEVGGSAELLVSDDGPGVGKQHRERIFERFSRLDESRDRISGGSGLGLAIARDIARRHGGDVTLEPSNDLGATFKLQIPLAT